MTGPKMGGRSGACSISYVLSYGQIENRMVGNENNLDIMRRKAQTLIAERHPHPLLDDTYVWGGPEKGRMVGQRSCKGGRAVSGGSGGSQYSVPIQVP
jgi:hypothetical protein